jgi:5,10-methylenetetrahydromethanopterin reductase
VLFAVDEDREVARRLVKTVLVDYLLRRMVADRRLSAAGIAPEEFAEVRDGLRGAWLRGGTQAAVDYLPSWVCERLSVCGTPDECIAGLDELRSAGLGTAVLFNVLGRTPVDGLSLIATRILPTFRT